MSAVTRLIMACSRNLVMCHYRCFADDEQPEQPHAAEDKPPHCWPCPLLLKVKILLLLMRPLQTLYPHLQQ